jgi:hypothetical protein
LKQFRESLELRSSQKRLTFSDINPHRPPFELRSIAFQSCPQIVPVDKFDIPESLGTPLGILDQPDAGQLEVDLSEQVKAVDQPVSLTLKGSKNASTSASTMSNGRFPTNAV